MSSQLPPDSQQPSPHGELWRLRGVQRAQPHLGEGDHSRMAVWAILAGVMLVLVIAGVFIFVGLDPLKSTQGIPTVLTPTASRTATAADTLRPASSPTRTFTHTSIPTNTPTPITPSPTVPTPRPSATTVVRYRVRPGDTLTSIAVKYHVSIQAIMAANRLRRDTIYDGEELIIPPATRAP